MKEKIIFVLTRGITKKLGWSEGLPCICLLMTLIKYANSHLLLDTLYLE